MSEKTKAAVAARLASLKKQLAERGQDPKYLEQMLGRMVVEKAKSLDDAEISRAFSNSVLGDFCIRYIQVARECGLTLEDVYLESGPSATADGGAVAIARAQDQHRQDDAPSPM